MDYFILDLSIVLVVAGVLSVLAVVSKQPIIIAYILAGVVAGPWGMGWVNHIEFIDVISHIGITLLLFLAGLCLHPQKLIRLFKKTTLVTLGGSLASFGLAFLFALIFRFNLIDSLCIGFALMFSSTILTIKLLPTTELHHKRMGAICIGVLILQDLLAIAVLAFIRCMSSADAILASFGLILLKLVGFIALLIVFEQFILRKMLAHVERMHELLFIIGLAWCFGLAAITNKMGLFYETGAFFGGVVLARHPIALFISEKLKPLRDFFLVLFFFTLGAKLDFLIMKQIVVPSIILAIIFIFFKPWYFKKTFFIAGETKAFAKEAGVRLGQLSEFSLLVAILALELGHISSTASQLIQLTTIFTFIASSYFVVYSYPTPIGTSEQLIQD